jgi:hypothetical protein
MSFTKMKAATGAIRSDAANSTALSATNHGRPIQQIGERRQRR